MDKQALDRHITGNYGEDFFLGEEDEKEEAAEIHSLATFIQEKIRFKAPLQIEDVEEAIWEFINTRNPEEGPE